MMPREDVQLSDRARTMLRALVHRYVRDGQPVGSRTLAREAGIPLSAATVRNVMADLEDLGYLASPHTSSGRIPTDKGFRFYVDSLLQVQPLGDESVAALRQRLGEGGGGGREQLVDTASTLLSHLTHLAGVVTLPRRNHASLRHVEFLPLTERRVLAIMVINECEVQNRVIQTDRAFTESELQQVSNYLNREFAGQDVTTVRRRLLDAMDAERERLDQLMRSALEVGEKAFAEGDEEDGYVVAGQTNLMEFEELSDVERLRRLFDAFTQKRDILHVLDRCIAADGVQIFIGQEAGYEVFDGLSLVTARYAVEHEPVGVLGVIGPTRMPYHRVIPIVDVTARLLGAALNPSRS